MVRFSRFYFESSGKKLKQLKSLWKSQTKLNMTTECPICCDTLNKSTKAAITCELADCDFVACKACTRKYLLGTTDDPNCMKCHKAWSHAFVVANLNRSFVMNEYSKHRKALLVEREISKLPESAPLAEKQKLIDKVTTKVKSYMMRHF